MFPANYACRLRRLITDGKGWQFSISTGVKATINSWARFAPSPRGFYDETFGI